MVKDLYRIEYFDYEWIVRGEDGWGTYYFGNSCEDCEEWVFEHHGELTEIIEWGRKESTMDMWFNSDICWCADSETCKRTDCFRHLNNKNNQERIFTMSHLRYTELCLLSEECEIEKDNEKR